MAPLIPSTFIKHHKEGTGKYKGKIMSEIPEHIANLIPHSKGSYFVILIHDYLPEIYLYP